MTASLTKILKRTGNSVAKQVKKGLKNHKSVLDSAARMRKDDSDQPNYDAEAAQLAATIDLSDLDVIMDATSSELQAMAAQGGGMALAQIGANDRGELVNQVYDQSVDYSRQRSAELIGKKWINGKLIDNPDAAWSITEATRNELRVIIADAFAGKIPANQVEESIAEAGAFSSQRAILIARTEISRANNYGALAGYVAARDKAGLDVKKEWTLDAEACPVCVRNEADGAIDLEAEFSSGDLAPPAHPNCECSIAPVTGDDAAENADAS